MNKRIFILSILSFSFMYRFGFAANWSVPVGYEKISGPSKIKNYSNIIKDPNGIDLYGKRIVGNITNNSNPGVVKYLDKSKVFYYKGLLIQGSIDKQYYYVDNTIVDGQPYDYHVAALRAISKKSMIANGFDQKNALVVDQNDINNIQAKVPVSEKKEVDLFKLDLNNYKICDNLFDVTKYKQIEECRGSGFGTDKTDGFICSPDQMSYINGDNSSKLELNGYKLVTDTLVSFPRWYANLIKVYEKNGKFYLLKYFGDYNYKEEDNNEFSFMLNSNNITFKTYDNVFHIDLYEADKLLFNCK